MIDSPYNAGTYSTEQGPPPVSFEDLAQLVQEIDREYPRSKKRTKGFRWQEVSPPDVPPEPLVTARCFFELTPPEVLDQMILRDSMMRELRKELEEERRHREQL